MLQTTIEGKGITKEEYEEIHIEQDSVEEYNELTKFSSDTLQHKKHLVFVFHSNILKKMIYTINKDFDILDDNYSLESDSVIGNMVLASEEDAQEEKDDDNFKDGKPQNRLWYS